LFALRQDALRLDVIRLPTGSPPIARIQAPSGGWPALVRHARITGRHGPCATKAGAMFDPTPYDRMRTTAFPAPHEWLELSRELGKMAGLPPVGGGRRNAMQSRSRGDYEIAGRELIAEGADLRVQILTLARGQCVPWHYHSAVTDNFVCLDGPMIVETRAPRRAFRLEPGQRCAVPPKTAHYVYGEAQGPCRFVIVQGVGIYDFVAVGR
jgi:quercetin dioxygenase-like cupin family protein